MNEIVEDKWEQHGCAVFPQGHSAQIIAITSAGTMPPTVLEAIGKGRTELENKRLAQQIAREHNTYSQEREAAIAGMLDALKKARCEGVNYVLSMATVHEIDEAISTWEKLNQKSKQS